MSLEELNNRIKELENKNKNLEKENKLLKKEINELKTENNKLKKEYKYKYKKYKYYNQANEEMNEFFIKYYLYGDGKLEYYIREKYNTDFEDYIIDDKKIQKELKDLIYTINILDIIDENIFYNNKYIQNYYDTFEDFRCADDAIDYLNDAFDSLYILEDFKKLNDFLDEKYNEYKKKIGIY